MNKELSENLNKIFKKLNKLEDGQLKFNQQIESLLNKVERLSLNHNDNHILNSHIQQLKIPQAQSNGIRRGNIYN